MANEFPQLAFYEWLAGGIFKLLAPLCRDDNPERFLARAVDHADLEWRLRAQRLGAPQRAFR